MHHMMDCDDTYKIYTQFAIHKLEAIYGKIPFKCAIGAMSKQILTRVEEDTLDINLEDDDEEKEIDGIIMMDRSVDPLSPFIYQRTYEGRLDDNFSIDTNVVKVANKIAITEQTRKEEDLAADEKNQYLLNNDSYKLYKEIRGDHHNNAVKKLDSHIKSINSQQANIQESSNDKKVSKEDIENLQNEKDITAMHINISFYFKTAHDNLDQKMLDELEQKCISRDNKDNKGNVKDFVS